VALLAVAGFAAGPLAPVVIPIAFLVTLYLLWAHDLGFKDAWQRFGLNRLTPPLWNDENRRRFGPFFENREKLIKAGTVAVGLVALWLMLPPDLVRIAVVVLVVWYLTEIYRVQRVADRADSARFN
jgi:fatty acid desaturase